MPALDISLSNDCIYMPALDISLSNDCRYGFAIPTNTLGTIDVINFGRLSPAGQFYIKIERFCNRK